MEVSMNTKKLLNLFVLIAMLLTSLAFTSPAFAAPASAGQCGTSATVLSGDTLRKIADRCGTTVSALRRANPEIGNGNLIYPGQVLLLPGTILGSDGGYLIYIVARGDTVKGLAARFGSTVDSILASNPEIRNVNLIYEGQRLTIYAAGPGNPPPGDPPPGGQTYYAVRGDTLRKIAAKFGTTVDALLRLNPQITNPNIIYVGQAIKVPGTSSTTTYTVQRGDTLRIIANKFGTTVDALLALNPKIKNPNLIYVGQVITVR
ncbi:MAG: LysM peptidoglycan-binding domain-containing protein [Chloroflexi bacterium]|nr:MAG: LysM peptidoglycan-binding domain-containing protein [Chloroflexota bacterium]